MRVFIDWENIRIALRYQGYNGRPEDLLNAVLACVPPDEAGHTAVVVTTARGLTHGEGERLRAFAEGGAPVELCRVPDGKNVADTDISFKVGAHVVRDSPSSLAIASGDQSVVRVAQLAAHESQGGVLQANVVWAHQVGSNPPKAGPYSVVEVGGSHAGRLHARTHTARAATTEDKAAWFLRQVALLAHGEEAGALHNDERVERKPSWWSPAKRFADLATLADVDHVLWRAAHLSQSKRLLLTPELLAETISGELGLPQPAVQRRVQALLVAGLLWVRPDGHLQPVTALSEGLLYPARRAVLLIHTKRAMTSRGLSDIHRRRSARPTRFGQFMLNADADESWGYVNHLLRGWGAVSVRAADRKRQISELYSLNPQHSLVEDTLATARLVWELLHEPKSNEQMAASLASQGRSDVQASRWMRLMADAQVLAHDQRTRTYLRKADSFG